MKLSFRCFFISQTILLEAWKEFWIIKSAVGLVKSHHFLKVWQRNILYSKNTLSKRYVLFCIVHTSLPMLWLFSCSVVSDSMIPWTVPNQAPLCPWDFPGKNTGMGCHFLLQGIFPTEGSNWVSHTVGRRFTLWATRASLSFNMFSQMVVSLL